MTALAPLPRRRRPRTGAGSARTTAGAPRPVTGPGTPLAGEPTRLTSDLVHGITRMPVTW
jgi:hypothetical protein